MNNQDKTFHCTSQGVFACYGDSRKHQFIRYDDESINNTQLYGNSYKGFSHQDHETYKFNYLQNHLYEKCLYGVAACSTEELENMTAQEKMSMNYNHKRTQQLINLSKWKYSINFSNSFLKALKFTHKLEKNITWFINSVLDVEPGDNNEINRASLRDIGGKTKLIEKMIENKILPSNFYKLSYQ